MRSDPQPDDPYLQTDRGECPDCNGRGCEPPKVQRVFQPGDATHWQPLPAPPAANLNIPAEEEESF
jgi:hypothetical protein